MLPPSARVGVFAPSHRFDPDRFERGLALLRAAGHEPVLGPNLNRAHRYFAGTDAERLADLVWALTDPSLDAAMMVRGGSGLGRLLPLLSAGQPTPATRCRTRWAPPASTLRSPRRAR